MTEEQRQAIHQAHIKQAIQHLDEISERHYGLINGNFSAIAEKYSLKVRELRQAYEEVEQARRPKIELSRNINYDDRLGRYTLDIIIDGENETLTFDNQYYANREYNKLKRNGATLMPLELDGSL